MRIESIDVDSGVSLAARISYSELKGLRGKAGPNALADNSGVRYLQENGWRGTDLYEITRSLQLSGKNNKIMLLSLLKRGSLLELISLMDKGLIIEGLRFMSQEKILRLMMMLPGPAITPAVTMRLLLRMRPRLRPRLRIGTVRRRR
mgnify:CR=1 FL=1